MRVWLARLSGNVHAIALVIVAPPIVSNGCVVNGISARTAC